MIDEHVFSIDDKIFKSTTFDKNNFKVIFYLRNKGLVLPGQFRLAGFINWSILHLQLYTQNTKR